MSRAGTSSTRSSSLMNTSVMATPSSSGSGLKTHRRASSASVSGASSSSPSSSATALPLSLVYGVSFRARAMSASLSNRGRARFVLSTHSLREANEVHVLEVGEHATTAQPSLKRIGVFAHRPEIWHLAPSPTHSDLLFTTSNRVDGEISSTETALFRMDGNKKRLVSVLQLDQPSGTEFVSVTWQPQQQESWQVVAMCKDRLTLWDLNVGQSSSATMSSELTDDPSSTRRLSLCAGLWDPHFDSLFVSVGSTGVQLWDWRIKDGKSMTNSLATQDCLRSLDINPVRPHQLVSGSDGGTLEWWDTRHLNKPTHSLAAHTHWIWNVLYHPTREQYVLSSGSDTAVNLWDVRSISSSSVSTSSIHSLNRDRSLVKSYADHNDSVYGLAWSRATADSWLFASLSYDGRFVINEAAH